MIKVHKKYKSAPPNFITRRLEEKIKPPPNWGKTFREERNHE
jgi:hypothetical protein